MWAWLNRLWAYCAAVARSGPVAALARIRGSWCHSPNWRSSRRCGWPARLSRRRSSQALNSRSCLSVAGSTPQLTSRSRR